jgi:hypothetical protein
MNDPWLRASVKRLHLNLVLTRFGAVDDLSLIWRPDRAGAFLFEGDARERSPGEIVPPKVTDGASWS